MKAVLYYCELFSFCLLICYIFSSCKSTKPVVGVLKGGSDPGDTRAVIRIVGSDASGHLIMIDKKGRPAEDYEAYSDQKVKWRILDSNVKSITMMTAKADSFTIFSNLPEKAKHSKNWKGKLKKTPIKIQDLYNIKWKDSDDSTHTFDPVIKVNPQ